MGKLKGITILVTGGTGFIGGHLVARLLQEEAVVVIPYIDIDPLSVFAKNKLNKQVILESIDITDTEKIVDFTKKHTVDYILHLAAQTIVTKAYENPYLTLKTNIIGTISVLEATRINSKIKGVIVASSDKAYGKTKNAYTEKSPLLGDHPYDVSKSSADLISHSYFVTYNTPVVVTRFGNVYGEGDSHFERLIPGLCRSIINKEIFEIRSDGTYVRDYIYVEDVVEGYMILLQKIDSIHGEVYNFSSSDMLSVLDVIKKAEKIFGVTIPFDIKNTAKNEIPFQHLDDTKIKKLGWKQRFNLDNSLQKIFQWYNEACK